MAFLFTSLSSDLKVPIGLSRKNQGNNDSSSHFLYTFHVFYTITTRLVILSVFRSLFLKKPFSLTRRGARLIPLLHLRVQG